MTYPSENILFTSGSYAGISTNTITIHPSSFPLNCTGSFTFNIEPIIENFFIKNNKKLKIGSYYEISSFIVYSTTKQAIYDHKKQKYVINENTPGKWPNKNSLLFLTAKTKIKNKIVYIFADNKGFLHMYHRSKNRFYTSMIIKELELNLWQV